MNPTAIRLNHSSLLKGNFYHCVKTNVHHITLKFIFCFKITLTIAIDQETFVNRRKRNEKTIT